MKGKIKGLYRRGQVWWWASQQNGKKAWVSLETTDEQEANIKAAQMQSVFVEKAMGWEAEVLAYITASRESGRLSEIYSISRKSILLKSLSEKSKMYAGRAEGLDFGKWCFTYAEDHEHALLQPLHQSSEPCQIVLLPYGGSFHLSTACHGSLMWYLQNSG